jgi:hypothetical protein
MNHNFSFITLYFSLSKEDRKSFRLFINKNHRNKESFSKVMNHLKTLKGKGEDYHAEKLAKAVFKDKSKNKELGSLLSALDEKCREWLILDDYQNNSIESKTLLLDIMNRKGISEDIYYKRNKQMQKIISESPILDARREYNNWKTTHEAIFHSSFNHIQQREKEQLMQQAEESLDNFHTLTKLQYTYERIVAIRLIESDEVKKLTHNAHTLSAKYLNDKHPLIRFFALVIQLELTENIDFYDTAKNLLSENDHLVSPIQLPTYFTCLHNFTLKACKSKKLSKEHLFDLQKFATERDWITGGGQMPTVTFNNIVNVACSLNETEWAKFFVKKYTAKLPISTGDTAAVLANARILFSEQKFKEAGALLSSTKHNIDFAALRINSLLMCCHYEANQTNVNFLKSTFRNFQIQIQNMKVVNKKVKEGYLNFIKILIKFTNKNTDYQKLLVTANQSKSLVYRGWLTEKIKEKM